jgi:hypothetical protein
MTEAPTYSAQDVQAILAEALAMKASDAFTRTQLLEMAAEMNISSDLLDQVETHWRQRQQHYAQEQARKQKQRRQFRQQLITYAGVNSGLILLNFMTAGTITWAIYPLLGWGLGLLLGGGRDSACHRWPQAGTP